MNTKLKDKLFTFLLYLPIISICSIGFFIYGWDKKVIILFVISIFASIYKYGLSTIKNNYKDPYIIIVTITTLYGSILYETIGYGSSEIRTLIACSLFFLFFPKEKITIKWLPLLLFTASVISFSFMIYSRLYLNLGRDDWQYNALPYAITLCLFAISSLYLFTQSKNLCMLLSFILFTVSILLTESRGPVLAILSASFILISLSVINKKNYKKTIISSFVVIITIVGCTYDSISERVDDTRQEISALSQGNYYSSIGLRLQMWAATPDLIANSPIIGVGDSHKKLLAEIIEKKGNDDGLIYFSPNHYHNQYLDKLVKTGMIGLILCLLLIYYPSYYFIKNKSNSNKDIKILAYLIAYTITICSLTDVPINQSFCLFPLLILNYFIISQKN